VGLNIDKKEYNRMERVTVFKACPMPTKTACKRR
jgi:hypothetical protein